MTNAELVEKVVQEIWHALSPPFSSAEDRRDLARAAIAVVLEEAAKVADKAAKENMDAHIKAARRAQKLKGSPLLDMYDNAEIGSVECASAASEAPSIAAAIRAMKE